MNMATSDFEGQDVIITFEKEGADTIRTGVAQFGVGLSVAPVRIQRSTNTSKAGVQEGKDRGMAPLGFRVVEHAVYFGAGATGSERTFFQQDLWHYTVQKMVDACMTHGLKPFYGPFGDFSDPAACEAQFRNAFLQGCLGAWSLHPTQIDIAKRVFSLEPGEVAFAKRIVEAMPDGMPQHHPGVTTLGVPKVLARRWAKANSRPFGSPSPKATDSGPYASFNVRSFCAIVSSASSQEIRSHLPSPRVPTLFCGYMRRSGWCSTSGIENRPFFTGQS